MYLKELKSRTSTSPKELKPRTTPLRETQNKNNKNTQGTQTATTLLAELQSRTSAPLKPRATTFLAELKLRTTTSQKEVNQKQKKRKQLIFISIMRKMRKDVNKKNTIIAP